MNDVFSYFCTGGAAPDFPRRSGAHKGPAAPDRAQSERPALRLEARVRRLLPGRLQAELSGTYESESLPSNCVGLSILRVSRTKDDYRPTHSQYDDYVTNDDYDGYQGPLNDGYKPQEVRHRVNDLTARKETTSDCTLFS